VPVIKGLELTGAVRYDRVTAIDSKGTTVGQDMDAQHLQARRALSGGELGAPARVLRHRVQGAVDARNRATSGRPGVTAANYDCPFPGTPSASEQAAVQPAGRGNAQLKPEKSDQMTMGIRFEPTADFGIGATTGRWRSVTR